MSEDDFYKLCAYGCLYKYNAERVGQIPPEDITLTFICDHFPRNMVRHIESKLKFVVKRYAKGVYYLYGGMFRMQIVVGRQLPKGEYFWLKWLRNDIMAGAEIKEIVKNYGPNKSLQLYQAVMNVIMRANWKQMEVEKEMCEALRELFADELKESELRGKLHGINLAKKVFRLHEAGYSIDEIAKKCDIDVKKAEEILA